MAVKFMDSLALFAFLEIPTDSEKIPNYKAIDTISNRVGPLVQGF